MLSRGHSSASARARRAKSVQSISSQPEESRYAGFHDEFAAHQNAVVAAERAYNNGCENSGGQQSNPDHFAEDGSASRASAGTLSRRQSIRFAGPTAVPLRHESLIRRRPSIYRSHRMGHGRPFREYEEKIERSFPLVIQAGANDISCDDDDNAAPGSQNGLLHHSQSKKSLRSGQEAPEALSSRAGRHLRRRSVRSCEDLHVPKKRISLHAAKSSSFLRDIAEALRPVKRTHEIGAATLSRTEDVSQNNQVGRNLKQKPSFLHIKSRSCVASHSRTANRLDTAEQLERQVRGTEEEATSKLTQPSESTARTMSQSIKNKLKGVFRLKKRARKIFPVQHLQASRAHFNHESSGFVNGMLNYPPIPSPDVELLRRVGSREALVPQGLEALKMHQYASTAESRSSENLTCIDRSRVTSWADSSAANTISVPINMERKRLSVIREDGDLHPLSPLLIHSKLSPTWSKIAAHGTLHLPLAQAENKAETSVHPDINNVEAATGSKTSLSQQHYVMQTCVDTAFDHTAHREDDCNASENNDELKSEIIDATNPTIRQGPWVETGSTRFPADTRIEQERGVSPYRKSRPFARQSFCHSWDEYRHPDSEGRPFPSPSLTAACAAVSSGHRSVSNYPHSSRSESPKAEERRTTADIEQAEARRRQTLDKTELAGSRITSGTFLWRPEDITISSRNSRDWQSMLASEMASADTILNQRSVGQRGSPKVFKHVCEPAQIDNQEDTEDCSFGAIASVKSHRLTANTSSRNPTTPTLLCQRSPLLDITPKPNFDLATPTRETVAVSSLSAMKENTNGQNDEGSVGRSRIMHEYLSSPKFLGSQGGIKSPSRNLPYQRWPKAMGNVRQLQGSSSSREGRKEGVGSPHTSPRSTREAKAAPAISALQESQRTPRTRSPKDNGLRGAAQFDKAQLVESFLRDRRQAKRVDSRQGGDAAAFL